MKQGNYILKLFNSIFNAPRLLLRLVIDSRYSKTYFPEEKQKSKLTILLDHLFWVAKHKEINHFYYLYGMDRKKNNAHNEVLAYNTFCSIRDNANLNPETGNFNYACMLRDKFIFGQFLSSLQVPTPKNIALLDSDEITWLDTMTTSLLETLPKQNITINGFCKNLAGMMGRGAFPLSTSGGKIYSGDTELTIQELRKKLDGKFLWQECVIQHETMSKLHASSINTLRFITFNNNGKIEVFSGILRIGTNNNHVDNWNAGGIAASIDLNFGTVRHMAIYKTGYGGRVTSHPNTGIELHGFEIPFFKECLEMIRRLHGYFYGVHSIGWDIAITKDGPVFIEGNDDWDGSMPMSLERNFKIRFLKMFPMNEKIRKLKNQLHSWWSISTITLLYDLDVIIVF